MHWLLWSILQISEGIPDSENNRCSAVIHVVNPLSLLRVARAQISQIIIWKVRLRKEAGVRSWKDFGAWWRGSWIISNRTSDIIRLASCKDSSKCSVECQLEEASSRCDAEQKVDSEGYVWENQRNLIIDWIWRVKW